MDLAKLLGIRQASVSCAKKSGSIPAKWLLTLLQLRGVNPDWVLHGTEPRYLIAKSDGTEEFSLDAGLGGFVKEARRRQILRYFPSSELADELVRRSAWAPAASSRSAALQAEAMDYETLGRARPGRADGSEGPESFDPAAG